MVPVRVTEKFIIFSGVPSSRVLRVRCFPRRRGAANRDRDARIRARRSRARRAELFPGGKHGVAKARFAEVILTSFSAATPRAVFPRSGPARTRRPRAGTPVGAARPRAPTTGAVSPVAPPSVFLLFTPCQYGGPSCCVAVRAPLASSERTVCRACLPLVRMRVSVARVARTSRTQARLL